MSLYLEGVVGCLVAVRGRVAVLAVVPGLQGGTGGFSPTPCRGTALQYQQVAELTETNGRVPGARASPPWSASQSLGRSRLVSSLDCELRRPADETCTGWLVI